ncbi:MAG: 50S ribosomal protein L11 methyltransferase, partial [Desulfamplus sp.]|nr:50S ribosomal protein L11 methyltransferase [Desulfamplus sp.]
MKWIHVKALFESMDISFGEELVSDMFFTLGLKGVVCQVPLEAPPEGFGSDAIPIPDENWISGYLPDTDSSIEMLEKIRQRAEELAALDIKIV